MKSYVAHASIILSSLLLLTACQQHANHNQYAASEVGVSRAVEFGTIINRREVEIIGTASGAGMLGGAGLGGGGASYIGDGSGNAWATIGGAVAGAVIGHAIEKELNTNMGHEYTLAMRDGSVKTIVQEIHEENPVLHSGDKVMLQYCDAGDYQRKCATASNYQRLMKVDIFPPEAKKKKKSKKSKQQQAIERAIESNMEDL